MTTRSRITAGMLAGFLALSIAACSASDDEQETAPRGGAVTGDSSGDLGSPTEEMQDASIEPSSLFGETSEQAMEEFARALNASDFETAVGYMSPYGVLDMTSELSESDPESALEKMLTYERIMESGGIGAARDESTWTFVTREDGTARGGIVTRVMGTEGTRNYFGAPMMETDQGFQVDGIVYEREW